jgi:hypothetical protein
MSTSGSSKSSGIPGCVIFKKGDLVKKYFVRHNGQKSGLGLCLAKFLNLVDDDDDKSKEQGGEDFFECIWSFRRYADPEDKGMLSLEEIQRVSLANTYKVDLDAKTIAVVAREQDMGNLRYTETRANTHLEVFLADVALALLLGYGSLLKDVSDLPWGSVVWEKTDYLAVGNFLLRISQDLRDENKWGPSHEMVLVRDILRRCADIEEEELKSFSDRLVRCAADKDFEESSSEAQKALDAFGEELKTFSDLLAHEDKRSQEPVLGPLVHSMATSEWNPMKESVRKALDAFEKVSEEREAAENAVQTEVSAPEFLEWCAASPCE